MFLLQLKGEGWVTPVNIVNDTKLYCALPHKKNQIYQKKEAINIKIQA